MLKIRAVLICVIASLTSACAWFDLGEFEDESVQATVISTDQAIEQFLTGRDLDPIEGAWLQDENGIEIVIARNTFGIAPGYDYVGIITRSDHPKWAQGDVKLLLRKTESVGVFDGVWVTRYKSEREMTFVAQHRNLVQASYVSNDGNSYFVRIRRMNPRFSRVQY
jgi:hypothetical protein